MRVSTYSFLSFLIVLPLILAVLLGFKTFVVWPQITYLWETRLGLFEGFQEFGAHGLRYALMFPILWTSELLGISYDLLFSYVILPIVFWTGHNCIIAVKECNPEFRQSLLSSFLVFGSLTAIFFVMNGRIAMALLGYSLLLPALLAVQQRKRVNLVTIVMMLSGMILCGVSSGTLVSAIAAFLLTVFIALGLIVTRLRLNRTTFVLAVTLALAVYVLGNSLFIGILKNLEYFGGFVQMLDHGYGRIFLDIVYGVPPWLLVISGVLLVLAGVSALQMFRYPHLTAVFILACGCGAFGYSTLSVAVIPALVLSLLYLEKSRFFSNRSRRPVLDKYGS